MHRIAYGENENHFGYLRLPAGKGPFPVAIVIHGGFWRAKMDLEHVNELAEALTAHGIATWNIEYRRVGQAGGGWPGTFQDNAQAADYVRTLAESYPLNLNQVVTIGHSAGGHLAVWLAARHRLTENSTVNRGENPLRLKGAVSLAGVLDLALMHDVHQRRIAITGVYDNPTRDLLGGAPDELPVRYAEGSPSALLPIGIPLTLIHGSLDINVPIGVSEQFAIAARAAGDDVRFHSLSTAEHFKLIDPQSEAWPVVLQSTLALLEVDVKDETGPLAR